MKHYLSSVLLLLCPLLSIAQQDVEQDTTTALAFVQQADKAYSSRNYNLAKQNYRKALSIYKNYKLWKQYFNVSIDLGRTYSRQNQLDSTLLLFKSFKQEMDSLSYFDYYQLYQINQNIAITYALQNNNTACIETFKKNVLLTKTRDPKTKTKVNLARTYQNIAVTYRELSNMEMALSYYDSALNDLKAHFDKPTEIEQVIYQNKAALLKDFGYFTDALKYLKYSKYLAKQISEDTDLIDQGFLHLTFGLFYSYRGEESSDYQMAIQYADSAYQSMVSADPQIIYLPYIHYLYSENYERLGAYNKALNHMRRAIKQNIAVHGNDFSELGYCYKMLGVIHKSLKNNDSASYYFSKSLKFYEGKNLENKEEAAEAFVSAAEFEASQGRYDAGLSIIQKGLHVLIPRFQPVSNLENPKSEHLYNSEILYLSLKTKADLLGEKYNLDQDIKTLKSKVDCYDKLVYNINLGRKQLTSLKSKTQFFNKKFAIYEMGIKTALEAYEKTNNLTYLQKAFQFSEQSKSQDLVDKITREQKIKLAVPEEWLAKEKGLKAQISALKKEKYMSEEDSTSAKDAQIIGLEHELGQVVAQINAAYPQYQATNTQDALDLNQLERELKKNGSSLIEFFAGKDNVYIFYLGHSLDYKKLPVSTSKLALDYLSSLKNRNYNPQLGYDLHHSLFSDWDLDNVIMIGDGVFSSIPYETLLYEKPNTNNIKDWPFMLKKTSITYQYAASLLLFKLPHKETSNALVAFAPGFNDSKNTLLATRSAADSITLGKLTALPYTQQEVAAIGQLTHGAVKTGNFATEYQFRNLAKNAGIIHIASHTIIDDQNPLYSKIILKKDDQNNYDGLIHTYELYNMNLNADLVTLSACNTGIGKYYNGEGVISLARGFMYAGVPNVAMSLWSVPDQSTSEIMQSFYKNMKDGHSKSQALRKAKLDYLSKADNITAAPYYWAGFVFIGEPEPTTHTVNLWMYVIMAGIVTAIVLFFLKSKRSKAH